MAVTWTAVQHNERPGDGATVAFPSNVTAGSLLIAAEAHGTSSITPATPTDTRGNSYQVIRRYPDTPHDQASIWWYAINGSSGANTVTFEDLSFDAMLIGEFTASAGTISQDLSGATPVETGTAMDHTNATDNTSSGSVTTQGADRLVLSFVSEVTSSVSWTAGTNYTEFGEIGLAGADTLHNALEYRTLTTAGSVAGTWTGSASGRAMVYVAAFKSSASDAQPVIAWVRA